MTARRRTFSSLKLIAVLARSSRVDVDIDSRMVRLVRLGHCRAISKSKLSARSSNVLGSTNSGKSSWPYVVRVYLYMSTIGRSFSAVICVSEERKVTE